MAADNLSRDVHSIRSFKLVTSNLQQNCCYQSPHLVFCLGHFNSISIIENLYDGELDNAPVFLYRNDTSSYQSIWWFYICLSTKIRISYRTQGTLLEYSSRQLKLYHLTCEETDFVQISHLNNKSIDLQSACLHRVAICGFTSGHNILQLESNFTALIEFFKIWFFNSLSKTLL